MSTGSGYSRPLEECTYCNRGVGIACRSTRDMEQASNRECFDALMRCGGGEVTINRMESERRESVFARWKMVR